MPLTIYIFSFFFLLFILHRPRYVIVFLVWRVMNEFTTICIDVCRPVARKIIFPNVQIDAKLFMFF